MAGYVIHIAVAQEYLKRHKEENKNEFIKGTIYPDLVSPKSLSHYGKSPAYTNLGEFLKYNKLDNSFKKGHFIHLITDYLFYNYYLETFSKDLIYTDYDILNKKLIEKYSVDLPENIKDFVKFKTGETKILSFDLACKVIDEIGNLEIEDVKSEITNKPEKWNVYKKLV